jgi:hypothetical protein
MFWKHKLSPDQARVEKETNKTIRIIKQNTQLLKKMEGLEELITIMRERKSHA